MAIGELAVLAGTFVADQAAAVATFGLAEAAGAGSVAASRKAVDYLEQQLGQHISGEVIEAAVNPLVDVVDVVGRAAGGLAFQATRRPAHMLWRVSTGVDTQAPVTDLACRHKRNCQSREHSKDAR